MSACQTSPKKVKNQKLQIFNVFSCIADVANCEKCCVIELTIYTINYISNAYALLNFKVFPRNKKCLMKYEITICYITLFF